MENINVRIIANYLTLKKLMFIQKKISGRTKPFKLKEETFKNIRKEIFRLKLKFSGNKALI
jgi:hypothetical protein